MTLKELAHVTVKLYTSSTCHASKINGITSVCVWEWFYWKSGNKDTLDSAEPERTSRDRGLFFIKGLSWNVHNNTFRYIKRPLNSIIKKTVGYKNDLKSERSFKVIFVKSKKYIQDTNLH